MLKLFKLLLKISATICLLVIILLSGISYYLEQHKQDLFSKFENWYTQNNSGTITFKDLSISTFRDFPHVAFRLKGLTISDTIKEKNQLNSLKIEDARLLVSLKNILNKEIHLQAIELSNGALTVVTNKDSSSTKGVFFSTKKDTLKVKKQKIIFLDNEIKVTIENLQVSLKNYQKDKEITGFINDLDTEIYINDSIINTNIEFNIQMNKMGFNLKKGTFFNNANVNGKLNATYDKGLQVITIPDFDLAIDDQNFMVNAKFSTIQQSSFDITLTNPNTNFEVTTKLLTQKIQQKLQKYSVSKNLHTFTSLKGTFKNGSNPLVQIKCATSNNTITINNKTVFNNVSFNGVFLNRVISETIHSTESTKNINLNFKNLKATYANIPLEFKKAIFTSTPKLKNYIDFDIITNAKTTTLNKVFNSESYIYTDGNYIFKSKFKGDVNTLNDIFKATESSLTISNAKLLYKPNSLSIQIDSLQLYIDKQNAILDILTIPIKNTTDNLNFSGSVTNIGGLVFNNQKKVTSKIDIYSKNLVWDDFLYLFKIDTDFTKNKKQKKDSLVFKEALNAVYKKLHPKLTIDIENFKYKNFSLKNLKTGAEFKTKNQIYLKETSFDYRNGYAIMELEMDISKPSKTYFDVDVITNNINLEKLLYDFDYFGLDALKEAKKINGNISVDAIMKGFLDEKKELDTKSLTGSIAFNLQNLELNGFTPIQKIAKKAFKEERFENIKFSSIIDTVYISNRTVNIPLLEIQSTAFNLFIDGQLNYDNKTNIWVAIPLSNIKQRKDLTNIPKKQSYISAGKKVFVEVKDDGAGNLSYKFHLNNKKYYKERDILNQYKPDHKLEQQTRKVDRKKARQLKRDLKKHQ